MGATCKFPRGESRERLRAKEENGDGKRGERIAGRIEVRCNQKEGSKEKEGERERGKRKEEAKRGKMSRERRTRSSNHPIKGSLLKDPYRVIGGDEIIRTTPIIGFRGT